MELRLAKKEDLPELKTIWKLCFHDEDSFIDFYYQSRNWISETAVLLSQGSIASMLTMIPVCMIGKDGKSCKASMLYAIATHPEFQKQGFADRLIEFSNQYLRSEQIPVTLLVPASEDLFRYYEKCGYRDRFCIREAVLSRGEVGKLAEYAKTVSIPPTGHAKTSLTPPCLVAPAEPTEYNRIRRTLLNGRSYLDYRDEELTFEKRIALMSGADLYSVESGGSRGCAYAERISQEEVIIKELLVPDPVLPAVLKQLSELLPADQYIVRTPADAGYLLGGTARHFGMIRVNADFDSGFGDSYLGFAFD